MRSLIVSCNISLDGFMAGPEGDLASLRFIVPDEEQEDDLADRFRSTVDSIVIGRQTFLDMEAHWTKIESPMADWINTTPKVVLTSEGDFDVSRWPGTTLAAGDGAEQVRRLKESEGRALVMFGGVASIRSMITAGLVDEFWLKISPVAVGRGSSMFAELGAALPLTLRTARTFRSGMIEAVYATSPQ